MKNIFVLTVALMVMIPFSVMALSVDEELVLAIDVSGSIDSSEYDLQMDGYVEAFRGSAVQDAIINGDEGAIAMNVVFFSSNAVVALQDWYLIDSPEDANAFADILDTLARPSSSDIGTQTDIAAGITAAATLLADDNGYEGRKVIDVSGDGYDNSGGSVGDARDTALAQGVDAINGLAITTAYSDLDDYYAENVIGGDKAFVIEATGFNSFSASVERKLVREISGEDPGKVPEPGTVLLLGSGLLGLLALKRKRRS
jgi:hypothetical protein